ncbi:hypothetical protein ACA910_012202 [Epithemia clementina (nom. ined.)]
MVAASYPLPNSFLPAIAGVRWPLGLESSPPLYFESLEQMKSHRNHDLVPFDFMRDIPGTVESLFPRGVGDEDSLERRHFGMISLALILLGHGFTDECHNLITPLSWPDDIHFAYGPSLYSHASPAAKSFSTYVHCLVHRKEAFNIGEFGMMGFQNGNYWSSAVARVPDSEKHIPHAGLLFEVNRIAAMSEFANCSPVKDWCDRHKLSDPATVYFEPKAVHELCATVLRQQQQAQQSQVDKAPNPQFEFFRNFAEQVAEAELRVLLAHTLPKAGFALTTAVQEQLQLSAIAPIISTERIDRGVDEYHAISALRKVSSAHLTRYLESGNIVLRHAVVGVEDKDSCISKPTAFYSAAAGVASRLLESPAVKESEKGADGSIQIVLKTNSLAYAAAVVNDVVEDLGTGDLYACSDLQQIDPSSDHGGLETNYFKATETKDPGAVFVNPLHGSSSETPTTVVQWSKGTIF